jgi:hypothetical protein
MSKRNVTRILFVICLFAIHSLTAMESDSPLSTIELKQSEVLIPARLGKISVTHDEEGFHVVKDGVRHDVNPYFVTKGLRDISYLQLEAFLGRKKHLIINGQMVEFTRAPQEDIEATLEKAEVIGSVALGAEVQKELLTPGGYISLNQMSDGQYSIKARARVLGGGPGGAVAGGWLAKFVSEVLCHGTIVAVGAGVSLVLTPAAGTTFVLAAEGTLAAPIEAFTTAMALAGTIAGGVVTGPV